MPFALSSGVPMTNYDMGLVNTTGPNYDLRAKLDMLDPCPDTILVSSFLLKLTMKEEKDRCDQLSVLGKSVDNSSRPF